MIEKFQYITHEINGFSHEQQTEIVCQAGCRWVQLRLKDKTEEEAWVIAKKVQRVCINYGAVFIINDYVNLAARILADGVHLGKSDMLPSDARSILGENFIIGGTANCFDDILNLKNQTVDYIGLGPYRFTETKKGLNPVLGLDGYLSIINLCKKNKIDIPVIAIGGIVSDDVIGLLNVGISGVAVSSAITSANDKVAVIQDFLSKLYPKI